MTTISFYARGDASNANNASLNVRNQSQQPTVQITFNSGPTGDIILESNGGGVDPDTTVTINGTTYNFTLEQTGNLPTGHPKVPDVLEGKQVTVISVVIGNKTERFFFVSDGSGTQALMTQFGNGAIALTNTDTAPPPVYICFCDGTDILTPGGNRKVEDLRAGDMVLNDVGEAVTILWMGKSEVSREAMQRDPERRPIRIPAHAIEKGMPHSDLYVSAQHRIVLQHALTELYFGEERVMVPAINLVGAVAEVVMPHQGITYYHILLESHEIVSANGLMSESFQPSERSYDGIAAGMSRSLANAVPQRILRGFFTRPDALLTLKKHEASVLTDRMFPARAGSTAPVRELELAA